MRFATLSFALSALLFAGCSSSDLEFGAVSPDDLDPVIGQTILFVGTDLTTLRTNIYQVQAVSPPDDFATDEERNAAVLTAEGFEVTVLTDFEVGEGPLQSDGDTLLPSEAPFAVPDRLGQRVALVATGTSETDDVPVGRAAVIDLATGSQTLAPDIEGLNGVRFTWLGTYLVMERQDPVTGLRGLSTMELDPFGELTVVDVEVPGATDVLLVGLLRDTDQFLVMANDGTSGTRIVRVDPATGSSETLVEPVGGGLDQLQVSRSGEFLAVTLTDPETGRRTIGVTQVGSVGPGAWIPLTASLDSDCSDPAWNPSRLAGESQLLAYVCHDLITARPDVMLWEGLTPPGGSSPPSMETLTGGAQPAVPDGSMDGLVLRARLRWDPSGQVLLFGASNADDAFYDEPMSLLVLDLAERRAVPVFDGGDGEADLAHFAAASSEPVLLVWNRSASGLDDSIGQHPIQLVAASPQGARTVRGVDLGRDLLIAYPLFLGGNTLIYP